MAFFNNINHCTIKTATPLFQFANGLFKELQSLRHINYKIASEPRSRNCHPIKWTWVQSVTFFVAICNFLFLLICRLKYLASISAIDSLVDFSNRLIIFSAGLNYLQTHFSLFAKICIFLYVTYDFQCWKLRVLMARSGLWFHQIAFRHFISRAGKRNKFVLNTVK
jgi:hypothetical protein